ncbi:uncharacterized protein LOC100679228 [Nasonia vitripennis]|uniref:Navisecapin-2 n=1 Tax=Nasonia vitripennis TaxID=7425 RepID=F6K6F2_NASVI|nr:uncharacterized protein LOC100679228 [Nasonia vitripennis]ADT89766.1 navisecapin-2 [Nasonia vitripennis]
MRRVWLVLLLLLAVVLEAARAESGQEPKKRFIPFAKGEDKVQEGSIINVPTRCPPNMLKVGNRCRTVY